MLWKFLQNSQEDICARISFLIKSDYVDLQLRVKKETLVQVFSCEFFEICKNTLFGEQKRMIASDYSSINCKEGRLAIETVNYDTKTKA